LIDARFIRNVLLKTLGLFIILNLLYMALDPLDAASWLGRISAYNRLLPGRERLPFGENPAKSYNLSLYNLDAMFASHKLAGAAKPPGEYRVLLVGDSSVWGILLRPEETLASQLTTGRLPTTCTGQSIRVYNLGYPTISLTKDLMLLDQVQRYEPDLIVWLTTLEAFPRDKQLTSPVVANNPQRVRDLIARYKLQLDPHDPALAQTNAWSRTIIAQRRALADLLRLQFYGVLWSATGIDQEYPDDYPPAQRDLDPDPTFHGWQPPTLDSSLLALDVLQAGMQAAGQVPILLVNEPILVSTGANSDIRYNFFYPRWAYDQYRQLLTDLSQQQGWSYLDLWNAVPQSQFTNSAIHLTPVGESMLMRELSKTIQYESCR
jgi:hypothetical protein